MFLSHGLNDKGELIPISKVSSGKTDLKCPFCLKSLLAKKGRIKEHHFSHVGDTCAESKDIIKQTAIPFYDIDSGLYQNEIKIFNKIGKYSYFKESWITEKQKETYLMLLHGELLEKRANENGNCVYFTELGSELYKNFNWENASKCMIPRANLQEEMIRVRLKMLEYKDGKDGSKAVEFYKLRLSSLLKQNLYVLNIKLELNGISYPIIKIGMTSRESIEDRLKEIKADLKKHGQVISIELNGFYNNYGSLERMMLNKFKPYLFKLGSHREYFYSIQSKEELKYSGLSDLGNRQVKDCKFKVNYRDHARKVKGGQNIQRLINKKHIGRKSKSDNQLLIDYPDIVDANKKGLSLRGAKKQTGRAINTIRRVYSAIG